MDIYEYSWVSINPQKKLKVGTCIDMDMRDGCEYLFTG